MESNIYSTVKTSRRGSKESTESYLDDTSDHPANPNPSPADTEFNHDFQASNANVGSQQLASENVMMGDSVQDRARLEFHSMQSHLQQILSAPGFRDDLLDRPNSWKSIHNFQKPRETLTKSACETMAQPNLNSTPESSLIAREAPIVTQDLPKDGIKVAEGINAESKPSNIDYLFQYSDDDGIGTEDYVVVDRAFRPVQNFHSMSGALQSASDTLSNEVEMASKAKTDVTGSDLPVPMNSNGLFIAQNPQPNVTLVSEDKATACSESNVDVLQSQTGEAFGSHHLHKSENPPTGAPLFSPEALAHDAQDSPPCNGPENHCNASSLPSELERAPESVELVGEDFEDNQITRFNDKAFRKALRELNPDLPRKLQWYAWDKVNGMLKSDNSQDIDIGHYSINAEDHADFLQRKSEDPGVSCTCNGNLADCSCTPDKCKCPKCPNSEAQTSINNTDQLMQEPTVHCLCDGGPFKCSKCEYLVDRDDAEELKEEEEKRLTFVKQEPLESSGLTHWPTTQMSTEYVRVPGLTCARTYSERHADSGDDEDAYSPKLELVDNRTLKTEVKRLEETFSDRSREDYASYERLQVPKDQMSKWFEQPANRVRSSSCESRIPSRPDTPRPVEFDVRQSVEPETWPRPYFRESTPAYIDRSRSPSPASYIEERDVRMKDYSPSARSSRTPSQCPTPTTAEPVEGHSRPNPHRLIAPPPIPVTDSHLRLSKRDGRRKSAVQGSKIEKSPTKSRNVTQKHGIARKVTGKKKSEERLGTKVKDAVAKIETSLQELNKLDHNDVDGKGVQETTPRRSSRIKAIKSKRSIPKLSTLY